MLNMISRNINKTSQNDMTIHENPCGKLLGQGSGNGGSVHFTGGQLVADLQFRGFTLFRWSRGIHHISKWLWVGDGRCALADFRESESYEQYFLDMGITDHKMTELEPPQLNNQGPRQWDWPFNTTVEDCLQQPPEGYVGKVARPDDAYIHNICPFLKFLNKAVHHLMLSGSAVWKRTF